MLNIRISIIVAIGKDRAIGKKGAGLLWHIPEDLRRFKELTTGHPVIMGRKTWESLPHNVRPLPERTNIVVTRDGTYAARGAQVATSLDEALALARSAPGGEEVFVMGGGELYALALPHADRLYLTLVEDDAVGDVFFPPYQKEFTKEIFREAHVSKAGIPFIWSTLER